MIKTSFTVGYRIGKVRTVVLGVTSIVPNLNGFLFFTEDGQNHFIESCDIEDNLLSGVYLEYTAEEDLKWEFSNRSDNYKVIDHRKK